MCLCSPATDLMHINNNGIYAISRNEKKHVSMPYLDDELSPLRHEYLESLHSCRDEFIHLILQKYLQSLFFFCSPQKYDRENKLRLALNHFRVFFDSSLRTSFDVVSISDSKFSSLKQSENKMQTISSPFQE